MWILYALIGFFSGVVGGMGLGGGTLLIPALSVAFSLSQTLAQGYNLISSVPMSAAALALHLKNGLVKKEGILYLIIPAVITGVSASFLAWILPSGQLKRIFGLFLCVLASVRLVSVSKTKR